MFLTVFIVGLLVIVVAGVGYLAWRQRRADDYAERLDASDMPSRANSDAQAMARTAGAARVGGGPFGP